MDGEHLHRPEAFHTVGHARGFAVAEAAPGAPGVALSLETSAKISFSMAFLFYSYIGKLW